MSRELTVRDLTPSTFAMVMNVAPVVHQSRLVAGITSPQAAAAVMLKGHELGMGLMASFEFIQIIQGRPTLSPRGALAIIQASGELEGLQIDDKPGHCTVWMKRKNGAEYRITYTLEEAKRAGIVKADSAWEKYESNMLRWRAIGFVADVLFADITGGLKRADEFGAQVDEQGNVIESEWRVEPSQTEPPAAIAAPNAITLDELVQQYGGERVIAAAEGKIPGTAEEVALVAAKLAGDG